MKNLGIKRAYSTGSGGFTLLEVLIAMTILVIISAVAVPSFRTFYSNQRLIGAAEQVYNHLQQARTESVTRNTTVYVNFSADGTTTWTYGMSSITSGCDLTQTAATGTSACVMVVNDGDTTVHGIGGATDTDDLVLNRFVSTDYTGVSLSLANMLPTSTSTQFVFSPQRGLATSYGQVNLSGNGKSMRVEVSMLGRAKLCSPSGSIKGYPSC